MKLYTTLPPEHQVLRQLPRPRARRCPPRYCYACSVNLLAQLKITVPKRAAGAV